MKKRMKLTDLAYSAIALVALSACQDEITHEKDTVYDSNEVAFTVGNPSSKGKTRADIARTVVAPSQVIDLPYEEDEQPLCLTETVINLDETTVDAVMGTRGTPVYTENFDDVYGSFLGTAFPLVDFDPNSIGDLDYDRSEIWGDDKENGGTVTYTPVKNKDNTYSFNYSSGEGSNTPWPATGFSEGKLLFFLVAPVNKDFEKTLVYNQDGSFYFNYTSPADVEVEEGETNDVAPTQQDILFTSAVVEEDSKTDNHILFYHALTGVKFKVGDYDTTTGSTITFNSVTLQNLYSKGTCTLTPNYESGVNTSPTDKSNVNGEPETKSAACAVWNNYSTPANFTVQFPAGTVSADDSDYEFPTSFTKQTTGANGTIDEYNLNDKNYEHTFWLIPQAVSPTVAGVTTYTKLSVTYTITQADKTSKTYTKLVDMPSEIWKAGELRTFTLSADQVIVDINETMTAATGIKQDVDFVNRGTSPQYQRVLLSANWVYSDETFGDVNVVAVDVLNDKSYFTGFDDGTYWVQGADGFFYYKKPINPGKAPLHRLFATFASPDTYTDYPGAHLELNIVVQAVKAELSSKTSANQYWGVSSTLVQGSSNTVGSQLSTTVETAQ